MAEPINFAFLHGQDHLSDYTLVFEARDPTQPACPPTYSPAGTPPPSSEQQPAATQQAAAASAPPASAQPPGKSPRKSPSKQAAASGRATPAGKQQRAKGARASAADQQQEQDAAADAAARNAGGASTSGTGVTPPNCRITRAFKRQRGGTDEQPTDTAPAADQPIATAPTGDQLPAGPNTRAAASRKLGHAAAAAQAATQRRRLSAVVQSLADAVPSPTGAAGRKVQGQEQGMGRQGAAGTRRLHRRTSTSPGLARLSELEPSPIACLEATAGGMCGGSRPDTSSPFYLEGLACLPDTTNPTGPCAPSAAPGCNTSTALQPPANKAEEHWVVVRGNAALQAAAAAGIGVGSSNGHGGSSSSLGAIVRRVEVPAHGVVLSVMSDYFRAIIEKWNRGDKRIVVQVSPDELDTAVALVAFMYTGRLPYLGQEDMLRLMKLADRYQVKNCPAACARRFAETPLAELHLETVSAIFEWPSFLQEGALEPFAGVLAKATAKLLDVFGDLEAAWRDEERRNAFLKLPFKAVKLLAQSDAVRCYSENTLLVALASWTDLNSPAYWSWQQRTELAELVRLQHLSPCFLGSVVKKLGCMGSAVGGDALMLTCRYTAANEATRAKLHALPNKQGRQKVLLAPPRQQSTTGRLEFDWQLELKEIRDLILQFKANRVTVDRYSDTHFFNGFEWQFVLQVLEPPTKPPGAVPPITPAPPIDVFVGATAKVRIGSASFLPDVAYFKGALAAREVSTGDFTFVNRMESGFVCGTAGWGFRNFLRITDWDSDEQCRRFFYDGRLHLRCTIEHCE